MMANAFSSSGILPRTGQKKHKCLLSKATDAPRQLPAGFLPAFPLQERTFLERPNSCFDFQPGPSGTFISFSPHQLPQRQRRQVWNCRWLACFWHSSAVILGFWQPLSGQEEGACWSRLVSWNTWVEGKGLKGRQETLHSGLIPQCDFWERRGCNQAGCFLFGILGNRAQPDLHQEGNRAQPTLHETVTSPFILSHISPNDSDNIQIRHGERLGSLG